MNKSELYTLLNEATASLGTYYPNMGPTIAETGLGPLFNAANLMRGHEPDAFTVEAYQKRFPYVARARQAANLAGLAEQGFAAEVAPGAYRLTEKGRTALDRVFDAAHADLAPLGPLPEGDMNRMVVLLQRLVDAALAAPEPAGKLALRHSRWTDPGPGSGLLARIDQYLTDLVGFRDDVHIASWQPSGVSGEAWEALTFLWRDQAHTAAELAEKLPGRAQSAEVYTQALNDLVARGWAEQDPSTPGAYRVTEQGRAVREKVEDSTNQLYFAPWHVLSDTERQELIALLTALREVARAEQAARQAAQAAAQAA